jgi:DNA-binding response OmpR family regulator
MKILIADDDRDLVDWLGYSFRREGYVVVGAYDGESALAKFESEAPDVVLLDLRMPMRTGLQVLQEIRKNSSVPVVMLTAVGDEDTVVQALKNGADDYVVKPFRPRELRARAQALLRRSQGGSPAVSPPTPLTCGDITLDPGTREVTLAGVPVKLTHNELGVLEYLILNQGTVMRIPDILVNVWGYDSDEDEEVVRVTVSRLRRKIEADPSRPRRVINVPGEGYKLVAPD